MSTTPQQDLTTPAGVASGNFVWHELRTNDPTAATEFYTYVVGWKAKRSGDPGGVPYTLLAAGDFDVAGLMDLTPGMLAGGMKPGWVGFIGVDDVDACAQRIEQNDGKLLSPAMDILVSSNFERLLWYLAYESSTDSSRRPSAGATVDAWMRSVKRDGRVEVPVDVLELARRDFLAERVSDDQVSPLQVTYDSVSTVC